MLLRPWGRRPGDGRRNRVAGFWFFRHLVHLPFQTSSQLAGRRERGGAHELPDGVAHVLAGWQLGAVAGPVLHVYDREQRATPEIQRRPRKEFTLGLDDAQPRPRNTLDGVREVRQLVHAVQVHEDGQPEVWTRPAIAGLPQVRDEPEGEVADF